MAKLVPRVYKHDHINLMPSTSPPFEYWCYYRVILHNVYLRRNSRLLKKRHLTVSPHQYTRYLRNEQIFLLAFLRFYWTTANEFREIYNWMSTWYILGIFTSSKRIIRFLLFPMKIKKKYADDKVRFLHKPRIYCYYILSYQKW